MGARVVAACSFKWAFEDASLSCLRERERVSTDERHQDTEATSEASHFLLSGRVWSAHLLYSCSFFGAGSAFHSMGHHFISQRMC